MATRSRFPGAKTNPLDDPLDAVGRSAEGESDLDEIQDIELQSGMPARNLRNIGVGIVAVGLLAFLMWPASSPGNKGGTPDLTQGSNLVEDLVSDLKEAPRPVALPEFPEPPGPPPMDREPEVDERIQLALIAPMAASDVELRNAGQQNRSIQKKSDPKADFVKLIDEQRTAREGALAQQARLIDTLASNGATGGAAQAQGLAGVLGDPRDSHSRFLAANRGNGTVGGADQLKPARTASTLYEGTLIRTVLTRPISSDLPGTFTAKVSTDLYDSVTQRILLVPRGSDISCAYDSNLLVGQEVMLTACTRLRLPNGKSFSLNGTPGSSEYGSTGLPADVNNHFWKMFGTALIVGASSYLLPSADRNISIVAGANGSKETAGNIFGSALSQVIESTISRNLKIPPTGTVDIGTPFTLTLTKDIEMEPYLASQRGVR